MAWNILIINILLLRTMQVMENLKIELQLNLIKLGTSLNKKLIKSSSNTLNGNYKSAVAIVD